jgi:hypothetical protein
VTRWLQSGLRRDICVVVAAATDPTETEVKTTLEGHYEDRIRPSQFHGAIDALVREDHLERRADGLQDRLSLTPECRQALEAHVDWVRQSIDA